VIQKTSDGPSILLVEDDEEQLRLLQQGLQRNNFKVTAVKDARSALARLSLEPFEVILSDLSLPGMNGDELLRHVRQIEPEMPFLMLTGVNDVTTAVQSMQDGADEYLLKPVTPSTLTSKVLAAIEKRTLTALQARKAREADLVKLIAFLRGVRTMVNALEAKDPYTKAHSRKVAQCAVMMAREIPGMDRDGCREIRVGALLHDIGKIGVPLEILHKNGPLNADEWDVVKEHPNYGARILEPLERHYPVVVDIVRSEHERWDGRGYPKGLAGKDIPLGSRIIMIADTYDAVCSTRPYRKAMDKDQALKIIREGAGSQFDPELVPVFEKVLADLPLPRY